MKIVSPYCTRSCCQATKQVLTHVLVTSLMKALQTKSTYVSCQVGVRVKSSSGNVELSCKVFDLVNQADDGLELLVGLRKSGLELGVGVNQALGLKQIKDVKI